jgi:serine/threonine-protein kinase
MASAGNRFGEIAVREGFASRDAVRECLEIQTKLKSFGVEPKRVGEIMVEKGYLREEDVKAILDVQRMGGSRMESRSGITEFKSRRIRAAKTVKKARKRVKEIPGYEVLDLLGEGGMGIVYRARQKSLDRVVALKILPASAARETSFIKRFISEARTVARLNHENIIAGIDVGEADGTYYFAMEHVEGESISEMIEKSGELEERFALQITAQMARALQHAHKHGLVHRDVKPQNILVTRNNLAKLCDLGLAKMQNDGGGSDPTGVPVGTPHYLSPEQARGEADVDIRSDIYSLGATLYHMLTGSTPFDGQSPMVLMTKHLTEEPIPARRRKASVSKGASDLVTRMMAKEKEDRHQTPGELLDDVERVLAGKKPSGARKSTSRRGSRRGGSRRQSGDSFKQAGVYNPDSRLEQRSRARRGAMIRSGRGSESFWLILIPLLVFSVIGSVVFMAYKGPSFNDGGGKNGGGKNSGNNAEAADAAIREARKLQLTDPGAARDRYRSIVKRYPGTQAARLAEQYLEEMGG